MGGGSTTAAAAAAAPPTAAAAAASGSAPAAAAALAAAPVLRSTQLLEELLAQPLDAEQWGRLAAMDPALRRIDTWRSRARQGASLCAVAATMALLAAALLMLTFFVLLLVSLMRPDLAERLEPAAKFIGDSLLGMPVGRPCLVSPTSVLPDAVAMQLLRAPVTSCGFCANLTEVPRVAGLDPAEFYRSYVDARIPVVVTDGAKDWRLGHLSFAFFRDLYSPGGAVEDEHCQFFPYKTEFTDLAHFFAMPAARARLEPGFPPWYVGWSNCSPRVATILRSYYSRPYFLPREAETLGTDWIFMGSPSYGAHVHVDDVGHPSWQAQVRGRKRWDLLPPLECAYECRPLSVVVQPGEVISLDTTLWYHGTHILEGDMSIAIGAEFD